MKNPRLPHQPDSLRPLSSLSWLSTQAQAKVGQAIRLPINSTCIGLLVLLGSAALSAATFGIVVPLIGGASDLVLDEGRNRLYLVNSPQNRVEVYSIAQRRLLDPISTGVQPLSAALSLSGKSLYVTSYAESTLEIIDLDSSVTTRRVNLPAAPEGVAVGGD